MFKSSVFLALVAPLVSALTVSPPTRSVTSGGPMTFNWQVQQGDPSTFSVYLSNPAFNNVFGVANDVDASTGTLTITIPLVPENQQYTIELVQIDDVNHVLAESAPFTIGATTATSSSTQSSASALTRSSVASSVATTAVTSSTSRVLPSSSSFGTIVSNTLQSTATAPASSGSLAASPSSSNTSAAALPARFNLNAGVLASVLLSVVAGVTVIAV
jgi:hypothetical protein